MIIRQRFYEIDERYQLWLEKVISLLGLRITGHADRETIWSDAGDRCSQRDITRESLGAHSEGVSAADFVCAVEAEDEQEAEDQADIHEAYCQARDAEEADANEAYLEYLSLEDSDYQNGSMRTDGN